MSRDDSLYRKFQCGELSDELEYFGVNGIKKTDDYNKLLENIIDSTWTLIQNYKKALNIEENIREREICNINSTKDLNAQKISLIKELKNKEKEIEKLSQDIKNEESKRDSLSRELKKEKNEVCLLKKQLLSKDEYHKRELNKFKVSLLSKKIPKDKSCQTNFHASDKYIGLDEEKYSQMVGLFEEKSQNLEEENIYLRKVLIDIYDAMVDSIKIIKKQEIRSKSDDLINLPFMSLSELCYDAYKNCLDLVDI